MTCYLCSGPLPASGYVSRRGHTFCEQGCSRAWAAMNPMLVKSANHGRSTERGKR